MVYHSIFTCNNCKKSLVLESTIKRKEYAENKNTKCREFFLRPCNCTLQKLSLKIKDVFQNTFVMTENTSSHYKDDI